MSIQPRRPMLAALQEALRKLESSGVRETTEAANLKRILRRRIADIEATNGSAKNSRSIGGQA